MTDHETDPWALPDGWQWMRALGRWEAIRMDGGNPCTDGPACVWHVMPIVRRRNAEDPPPKPEAVDRDIKPENRRRPSPCKACGGEMFPDENGWGPYCSRLCARSATADDTCTGCGEPHQADEECEQPEPEEDRSQPPPGAVTERWWYEAGRRSCDEEVENWMRKLAEALRHGVNLAADHNRLEDALDAALVENAQFRVDLERLRERLRKVQEVLYGS